MTQRTTTASFANGLPRYAVRVTGPAGHSTYLFQPKSVLEETDDASKAVTCEDSICAWAIADFYRKRIQGLNVVIDVVNLDDPEEQPPHD